MRLWGVSAFEDFPGAYTIRRWNGSRLRQAARAGR
jgi:hypothetical protein